LRRGARFQQREVLNHRIALRSGIEERPLWYSLVPPTPALRHPYLSPADTLVEEVPPDEVLFIDQPRFARTHPLRGGSRCLSARGVRRRNHCLSLKPQASRQPWHRSAKAGLSVEAFVELLRRGLNLSVVPCEAQRDAFAGKTVLPGSPWRTITVENRNRCLRKLSLGGSLARGAGEENPFLWGQAGHQRHEEGQLPRPCTAQGEPHLHFFKVYALDTPRDLKAERPRRSCWRR
jgi:hypothetical protein